VRFGAPVGARLVRQRVSDPRDTSTDMAFFSRLSSSIGKKLLLFGLRHIDILDKDPAEFISGVDVGKKTTLEVRDVGLHVKVSLHITYLACADLLLLETRCSPSYQTPTGDSSVQSSSFTFPCDCRPRTRRAAYYSRN